MNGWLALGVADGDIEYGDLSVGPDDADELSTTWRMSLSPI